MDSEQKYIEGSDDSEDITFQVEEGLLEDLTSSELSLPQAQIVAYMLEDNAERIPSGKGTLTAGGVARMEGEPDRFFEVDYFKKDGEIPCYYQFNETDVDTYLDHILTETDLIDYYHAEEQD